MAGVVHGTQDAIATNISRRVAIPSWPGFCFLVLVFGFCFCVFVLVVFLVLLFVLCFAHEAWECSLDYVQVRNRLLLRLVYFDGHAWEFTNSVSGKYKLVERPGESHEGVGRKKKIPSVFSSWSSGPVVSTGPSLWFSMYCDGSVTNPISGVLPLLISFHGTKASALCGTQPFTPAALKILARKIQNPSLDTGWFVCFVCWIVVFGVAKAGEMTRFCFLFIFIFSSEVLNSFVFLAGLSLAWSVSVCRQC